MRTSTSTTAGRGRTGLRSRQGGITVVEFAVVIPIALLLVFGIVQLGLMYTAKEVVNEGAFVAARAGAFNNAQLDKITEAMTRSLIPFYQDTTNSNDFSRISQALASAQRDTDCSSGNQCFLTLQILNPSSAAFEDFGISTSASGGHTFIPNDNLQFRPHSVKGPKSGLSIQDANALKIKVTYGYEMKVPLMSTVIGAVMCGISNGVRAFGSGNNANVVGGDDCTNFYSQGRIPIVSYATVQMQTPAFQAE
jgi:TadE-like protein